MDIDIHTLLPLAQNLRMEHILALLFIMLPIVYILQHYINNLIRTHIQHRPPVVLGLPFIGSGIQFQRDPVGFLKACQKRYGDVFSVKLAHHQLIFLVNPVDWKAYTSDPHLNFYDAIRDVNLRVFGQSSNTVGKFDHHWNGLYHTYLQGKELYQLINTAHQRFDDYFNEKLSGIDQSTESSYDLYDFVSDALLHVSTDTLFGVEHRLSSDEFFSAFKTFDRSFPQLAMQLPKFIERIFMKPAFEARNKLFQLFDRHMNAYDETKKMDVKIDTLDNDSSSSNTKSESKLMQERYSIFEKLRDVMKSAIYDHHTDAGAVQNGFYWASVANTVPTGFWLLYYLLTHNDAYIAVMKEVEWAVEQAKQTSDGLLTRDIMEQMPNLNSAIQETLRLSVQNAMIRQSAQNHELILDRKGVGSKRYVIKKNERLAAYAALVHLDPHIYPEPHVFKYNRFIADKNIRDRSIVEKHYLNPHVGGRNIKSVVSPEFGMGSQNICPGRYFVRAELQQMIILLFSRYNFHLTESHPLTYDKRRYGFGALPPVESIHAKITKRV